MHDTPNELFFFPATNINSNYSIWEQDFEEEFHKRLDNYDEIKAEAKNLYNSDSKPLTARYFSEKICETPAKIDAKIESLIQRIIDLEWSDSIIDRVLIRK